MEPCVLLWLRLDHRLLGLLRIARKGEATRTAREEAGQSQRQVSEVHQHRQPHRKGSDLGHFQGPRARCKRGR